MLYECWGAALTTKKKDIYVSISSLMDICALSSFVGFVFKRARSRPRSFLTRSIRFRFTTLGLYIILKYAYKSYLYLYSIDIFKIYNQIGDFLTFKDFVKLWNSFNTKKAFWKSFAILAVLVNFLKVTLSYFAILAVF